MNILSPIFLFSGSNSVFDEGHVHRASDRHAPLQPEDCAS